MKLRRPGYRSSNVEDRRGSPGASSGGGGGMGGFPIPMGKGGGIGAIILAVIIAVIGGVVATNQGGGTSGFDVDNTIPDPGAAEQPAAAQGLPAEADPDADLFDFVNVVFDDIQSHWQEYFAAGGSTYRDATLVVFDGGVNTGCGSASSAVGPFYCPPDETVYIDLGFFQELGTRFGAPGDFAQAYVIAHEVGHHIQTITGISDNVRAQQQENPDDANELSVRLELQADCLAGVWGYSAYSRDLLESGDLEEGLGAAGAVGDDRLQAQAGARVNPETWTHGSSEQRVGWFRAGFDNGDAGSCDTFSD